MGRVSYPYKVLLSLYVPRLEIVLSTRRDPESYRGSGWSGRQIRLSFIRSR